MSESKTVELTGNEAKLGPLRLSYVNLLEAKQIANTGDPKFSVSLLIPKTDQATLDKLKVAQEAARKLGVTAGKKPFADMSPEQVATMKLSWIDGDTQRPKNPECKGHWVLNAKSDADKPPGVLADIKGVGRINIKKGSEHSTEIYSGMFGMVHVQLYGYNKGNQQGIGCSIQNVLKTGDGDPLGGAIKRKAEDVFGAGDSPFEEAGVGASAPAAGSPI